MAKNKAKMNKFLTGAITATMVASAVVPVASAAAVDFSDVDKNSSHYPNIVKAAERGLMTGYSDGTFKPTLTMTRGQVVKALGKYIVGKENLTLDQYVEKYDLVAKVEAFNDVPATHADQELFKYSLVVKDAEAFTGNNNSLHATNDITRQQMSKVLVNAFDLKDISGVDVEVADMDTVFGEYKAYVTILAKHEITKADDGKFRPAESVTRQQMASFLNRSYDAVQPEVPVVTEVKSLEATSKTVDNTTRGQKLEFTVNNGSTATVEELVKLGYSVEFQANEDVFDSSRGAQSDTGVLNARALQNLYEANPAGDREFTYNVTVTKDGESIKSNDQTVSILDASLGAVTITNHTIKSTHATTGENFKLNSSTLVVGEEYQIDDLAATLPGGIKVDHLPELEDYHVSYSSSNTNVVVVDNNGVLIPVGKGNATVTVKSGDATRTINLTVTNELRVASKLTLAEPTVKLSTAATSSYDVTVTILDQYGDPVPAIQLSSFVQGLDTAVDVKNSKQEDIASVKDKGDLTNAKGEAQLEIDNAGTPKAGSGTLDLIRTNSSTVLAKLTVQTSDAADVKTRKIEKASNRMDKKFELTLGGSNDTLVLSGYTAGGYFVETETLVNATNTLPAAGQFGFRTTNPKVVAVSGTDQIEAIGVGKASIEAIDEKGSRVDVINYTVKDYGTKVAGGTFHDLNITATNNAPFDLSKDIINKLILTSGKSYAYHVDTTKNTVVIYVDDNANGSYDASEEVGEIRATSTVRDAGNAKQDVVFTQTSANDPVFVGKNIGGAASAFEEKDKGSIVLRIHNGIETNAPSIASTTINVDIK